MIYSCNGILIQLVQASLAKLCTWGKGEIQP